MLAVASNLFGKSSSLNAYTIHSADPSPSSSSANLPSTAGASSSSSAQSSGRTFNVGLWKVLGATHKTTGKDVSVWVFEKKILDGIKGDSAGRGAQFAKDWVVEHLKKEVSAVQDRSSLGDCPVLNSRHSLTLNRQPRYHVYAIPTSYTWSSLSKMPGAN